LPTSYSTAITLHLPDMYRDLSRVILADSGPSDMPFMARMANMYGYWWGEDIGDFMRENNETWGLVGTGRDDGEGTVTSGPQVSQLVQHPETLECILSFQGSASIGDWFTNGWALARPFCGLEQLVHEGFRDHFRRIVSNPTWQENIRPNLGKCSKLYVTGHSLGGAQSSLFMACAASAPYEDKDYDLIRWTQDTPQRLPYL